MALARTAAIFLMILIGGATASYGSGIAVGSPPPLFTLLDENGKWVNMGSLMDRPTILYFTHNACHYCTQIIAHLKRAYAEFGGENLRIMGINVMARDQRLVKAYKEELGFVFPMLAGNAPEVLEAYKIGYVPVLVFVDRQRIVRKVVGHYIQEPELHETIREIMDGKDWKEKE